MGNKAKHLELIQHIVSRMAGNLFYLRGWSITLIAALLALLSQQKNPDRVPLIMLASVVVIFWIYDSYFLSLERGYRDLYNKVRALPEDKIDYSMNIEEFKLNKKNTIIYCMFSKTLAPFYLLFLGAAIYLIIRVG